MLVWLWLDNPDHDVHLQTYPKRYQNASRLLCCSHFLHALVLVVGQP